MTKFKLASSRQVEGDLAIKSVLWLRVTGLSTILESLCVCNEDVYTARLSAAFGPNISF